MGNEARDIIDAFERGRMEREARERRRREIEDREFQKKIRQNELQKYTLETEAMKRQAALENAKILQGQPGPDFGKQGVAAPAAAPPQAVPAGAPSEVARILEGRGGPTPQPSQYDTTLRHAPMEIPGLPSMGVPGVTVRPESAEDIMGKARAEFAFKEGVKGAEARSEVELRKYYDQRAEEARRAHEMEKARVEAESRERVARINQGSASARNAIRAEEAKERTKILADERKAAREDRKVAAFNKQQMDAGEKGDWKTAPGMVGHEIEKLQRTDPKGVGVRRVPDDIDDNVMEQWLAYQYVLQAMQRGGAKNLDEAKNLARKWAKEDGWKTK